MRARAPDRPQASRLATDKEQREYVAFAKAAEHLEISTHSAEQASASAKFLTVVAKAMASMSRGVLRAQMAVSLRTLLSRLMDAPTKALAREWRDFCSAGGAEVGAWWQAYTAAYEAAFKWAKKPTHAPFSYELLVTMLALAALPDSHPGGTAFATGARRSRMLSLLIGAKKEPLRSACVPLAAQHVCALPAEAVRADLEGGSSGGGRDSSKDALSLRALVQSLLPRKAVLLASEAPHVEQLLLKLATAQRDAQYVLQLVLESLAVHQSGASPSQRSLLLRVLTTLSAEEPTAVQPHRQALLASLRPLLRFEAQQHLAAAAVAAVAAVGGPPMPESAGSGLLPALIAAVPRLWALETDAEECADLAWMARLLVSEEAETHTAAFECLQLLMALQRARLTVPVLTAVARMLLGHDGARPLQLSRALYYATFIVHRAVERLGAAIEEEAAPAGAFHETWQGLRQVMQAAAVAWVMHSLPGISQQAAALLNAFDSDALLRHLPPSHGRPALRSLLPSDWGRASTRKDAATAAVAATAPTQPLKPSSAAMLTPLLRESRRTASTQSDVENALDEHYEALFPTISLCWMRLAHQASSGPRPQADYQALQLWGTQLAFVCRYARTPLAPYYTAHTLSMPAGGGGADAALKPMHDRHTSTSGAAEEDVAHIFARSLRWLLSPTVPSEQLQALLKALRLAHPSMNALLIGQLKQAALEQQQQQSVQPPRGLSRRKPAAAAAAPDPYGDDLYYQPAVLELLAEMYAKRTAAELARTDDEGQLVHKIEVATLESICRLWLRDKAGGASKAASLNGAPLGHAARLMTYYLQYVTAALRNVPSPSAKPPVPTRLELAVREIEVPGARPGWYKEDETPPPGASTTASSGAPKGNGAVMGAMREEHAGARSWAPDSSTPLTAPEVSSVMVRSTFDLFMQWMRVALDSSGAVHDAAGRSSLSLMGGADSCVALVDPRDSNRLRRVAPSVEESVLHAVEALIAMHATAHVLGLLGEEKEKANGKGAAGLKDGGGNLRGQPPTVSMDSLQEAADAAGFAIEVKRFLEPLLGWVRLQSPTYLALATLLHHHESLLEVFLRTALKGGEILAPLPPSRTSSGAADVPKPLLVHAYLFAVVSNVASDMERWHKGIEARLLFLSLLHQVSDRDGQRALGASLAQALAHSPHTHLMPPHSHQLPLASARSPSPLVYTAAPYRYSSALAPLFLHLLPDLLSEMVRHFRILTVEDREALLQLLLPWLRALASAFDSAAPVAEATSEAAPAEATVAKGELGSWSREQLHVTLLVPALESLLSLSRLTSSVARPGLTAESAHMAFMVEEAWAALVSPGSTPTLVPALTGMLLSAHSAAAAAKPVDAAEIALCEQVLILATRTPCAPLLLGAVVSELRNYVEHCPDVRALEVSEPGVATSADASSAALWLNWRRSVPAVREPLRPYELAAISMLTQLPYELHALLPPHLPQLLHVLAVCYGEETASASLALASDRAAAEGAASTLMSALLSNLTPRGHAKPISQAELDALLSRAAALRPGLSAVRPLVQLLSPVRATIEEEWRLLALHWAVHARDPDMSLASLRCFALLGTRCDAALIHTLVLVLWGALREAATAKVQLLLRLLRNLAACTLATGDEDEENADGAGGLLPASTWLELAATAAAMLSVRCESLLTEALLLLELVLHVCEDDMSRDVRRASSFSRSLRDGNDTDFSMSASGTSSFVDANGMLSRRTMASSSLLPSGLGDVDVGRAVLSAPPLSQLLFSLRKVWKYDARYGAGSSGVGAGAGAQTLGRMSTVAAPAVDEYISARLLKGVSVGAEVSTQCRCLTIRMVERLAVCYADDVEMVPTNTLTITSLLARALELMLALPRALPAQASTSAPGVQAGGGDASSGGGGGGGSGGGGPGADRTVRAVASDAVRFLESSGSVSFERLVDLFNELAEWSPENDETTDEPMPSRTPSFSVGSRTPSFPSSLPSLSGARRSVGGLGTAHERGGSLGGGSSAVVGSADVSNSTCRTRKSGLHAIAPKEERKREALERALPGHEAWHASRFDERFFESFALAFTSTAEVDFTLRLLTEWLDAASRPLLGNGLHLRRPSDTCSGPEAALSMPSTAHSSSPGRVGRYAERSHSEARHARRVLASLLRLLSACVCQYAPTECVPEQFAALAPLVIAHFTHFTHHHAHQRMDPQEDVALTAERLLSEMLSRAPAGTDPKIFSLLSTPVLAGQPTGAGCGGGGGGTQRSSSITTREQLAPSLAWDACFVRADEIEVLYPSLHECADRLQACALNVAPDDGASERGWPLDLPRPLLSELPSSDPSSREGSGRGHGHGTDGGGNDLERPGQGASGGLSLAGAPPPKTAPTRMPNVEMPLRSAEIPLRSCDEMPSAEPAPALSAPALATEQPAPTEQEANEVEAVDAPEAAIEAEDTKEQENEEVEASASPPPPPPPPQPKTPSDRPSSKALDASSREPDACSEELDDHDEYERPARTPRVGSAAESDGSWISTIGPLARLEEYEAGEVGPSIDEGDEEDEELMVGLDGTDDDDDDFDDDGLDGTGQPSL